MFFVAKKLIGAMLMPFQLSVLLLVCGVILLWLNRGRRLAQCLVTAGAALLLIFSNSLVGYHYVHVIEAEYSPLLLAWQPEAGASSAQAPPVASKSDSIGQALGPNPYIVVLSGGASNDADLPGPDRLTPGSALRVVEAVEIYRSLTASHPMAGNSAQILVNENPVATGAPRILLSGGPTVNSVAEAIPMQTLAESLGVPASAILLETHSSDTASEAKDVLPIVRHQPFILVTSAFHMPRAVALFRHLGMQPIPAPADYRGRWTTKPFVLYVPPDADALVQSEIAWHERIGMIWERLWGQL